MKFAKPVAILAALAGPFMFPAVFSVLVVFCASIVLPPLGLLAGVIADALYYTPSVHVPYATLLGLLITVLGFFVQQFIKTRIMG